MFCESDEKIFCLQGKSAKGSWQMRTIAKPVSEIFIQGTGHALNRVAINIL